MERSKNYPHIMDVQDAGSAFEINIDHLVEEVVAVDGNKRFYTDEDVDSIETAKRLNELNSEVKTSAFWWKRKGINIEE